MLSGFSALWFDSVFYILEFSVMRKTRTWNDEFIGHRVYSATAGSNVGHNWRATSTGGPTYTPLDNATDSANGGVVVAESSTNEAQNACLNFADILPFDIDNLIEVNFRVKMNQALLNAASMFAIGLQGDRNDAIDSIAQHASFRLIGASAALFVESDDGTIDRDDIVTGATLEDSYKDLRISFANGTRDVRFFVDGQPVAESTTFDMSNYTGCLQPYAQLQKTAVTATDGFTLCSVEVTYRGH
jgi:hypothetical protein